MRAYFIRYKWTGRLAILLGALFSVWLVVAAGPFVVRHLAAAVIAITITLVYRGSEINWSLAAWLAGTFLLSVPVVWVWCQLTPYHGVLFVLLASALGVRYVNNNRKAAGGQQTGDGKGPRPFQH